MCYNHFYMKIINVIELFFVSGPIFEAKLLFSMSSPSKIPFSGPYVSDPAVDFPGKLWDKLSLIESRSKQGLAFASL